MKYTTEITNKLIEDYEAGKTIEQLSQELSEFNNGIDVPTRSLIAKLSSLGVYKKKEYRTKRGEIPVKKDEYITRIANIMQVNVDLLESMEKVNKSVLALIEKHLLAKSDSDEGCTGSE